MANTITTDVCIIGAGPGGAIAALRLAQLGIPSVLVDKAAFPRDKICGDALSGKVVEVLKKIDPSILTRLRVQPTQLGSWGVSFVAPNGKVLRVPFRKDINKDNASPGHIIKRIDFDDFLLQEALKYPSIKYYGNTNLDVFNHTHRGYQLTNKEGSIAIQTQLVIAADGAQSVFAKQVGNIRMEARHYCAGVRAYYQGVSGMDNNNFIELHFLQELLPGYFWIFPLPNGAANVGLGIRSDVVSRKKMNLRQLLSQVIESHPVLKERFKNAHLMDVIKGFGLPLGSKKRSLSSNNYMLVGDAASLIDPFTGEGIGNAMLSGMLAAEQAAEAIKQSCFSAHALNDYDRKVYQRLWSELSLSSRMQQLVNYPWLFNMVVNKANRNPTLQETISCMFEDLDMRARLKQPSFYFKLLFANK